MRGPARRIAFRGIPGLLLVLALLPSAAAAATVSDFPIANQTSLNSGWTNPNNAHADDGVYATSSPGKNSPNGQIYQIVFDAAEIPDGSTITSTTVEIQYRVSTTASTATLESRLYADSGGATSLSALFSDASEPTTDTIVTYVATTQPSIAQLRAGIWVDLIASRGNSNTPVTFSADYIRITIVYTPPVPTTTVGTGTDPNSVTICPGGAITDLDAFTLKTNTGTDAVTAVTVDFAAGTTAGMSQVSVTNDAGGTTYGQQANPTDPQTVSLTSTITATTTETPYKIRITPKTHAGMPAPPGSSYAATGTVTAITSSNAKVYNDTATTTVTIDNASPGNATWGTVTPGSAQITLNWTNPADPDLAQVVILRNTASIGDTPAEGSTYAVNDLMGTSRVVYAGTGTSFVDPNVANGTSYWYKAFARDACVNYATGAPTGPHTPAAADNRVSPGTPSATVDTCTRITVSAPYTNDGNGNSTTTFERGPSASGPWTPVCSSVSGPSPRVCVDAGVSESSTYHYRVTFSDDDGVIGDAQQVIGPYSTPPCSADGTTVSSSSADVSSCTQITVSSFFTGDDDGDGWTVVEYSLAGLGTWSTACAAVTGPSPRSCLVVGLSASTAYDIRVDFNDPDGVTGTDPQTDPNVTTISCGADSAPPTALILAPGRNAVVGGIDRVKVQVYDAGGLAASSPVTWSVDGGALSATGVSASTNYSCGTGCSVYEFDLDTTGLAGGAHYLTVKVIDAAIPANQAYVRWPFRVYNLGGRAGGDGHLLRRTPGSQICIDCHNLPTHSSQTTSPKRGNWAIECTTCHTPHRTRNIYLVPESLRTPNSGARTVQFSFDDRAGETNPGNLPGDNPARLSFLGDRSQASNAPYNDGICEVCHTRTKYWRNDATADHAHNASVRCLKCHAHDAGFKGSGRCLDCHATDTQGSRRAVEADFSLQSHHVGNGGTMGGSLTDFDCVVCHAEGIVDAGEVTTTTYHNDGLGEGGANRIDLKSSDNISTVYSYDKTEVATSAGAATNWHSGNATWRTETSQNLDPFCLTCHDSDGAVASYNATDGGSASNPFGDTLITNNYDRVSRGAVVNIKSKVSGSPPSAGQYARHAIRGQSTSRYTTYTLTSPDQSIRQFLGFTDMGTDEFGNPNWNDTSVMGCADCHTTDGANGTAGNAHGSGSEYLLKDSSGTASEGNMTSHSYNCYRCHVLDKYLDGGDHTGNSGDWQDYTAEVGSARIPVSNTGGNIYGMACTNCHGGYGFGSIHGTTDTFGTGLDGGVGTRQAYRFTNGASLRYYDPGGWTGTSATCYTLSAGDSWGGCVKHATSRGQDHTKLFQRPLDY